MPRRELRSLLFLAALAALWMLTQGIADLHAGWMIMAPALVLFVPLLAGRYVGEDALERVARRRAPPARRRVVAAAARLRAPRRARPAGGLLIAWRLAERGPPAALLAG